MKWLFFASAVFIGLSSAPLMAMGNTPDPNAEIAKSTTPIGSPFYRHVAHDFKVDLHELVKFEKKGFGRAEVITLILIAQEKEIQLKKLGNRRIKDKVSLKTLAEEAELDYDSLYKMVQDIKKDIELRGDSNLPPPVYPKKKTKKDKESDNATDDLGKEIK